MKCEYDSVVKQVKNTTDTTEKKAIQKDALNILKKFLSYVCLRNAYEEQT